MMLAMGVQAGEVLYAEVDGTNMTLKCGDAAPEGTQKYDGSDTWNLSFCKTITTATIDESCASYTGTTLALLFGNCSQLETITGLSNLNTANVTDMIGVFCYCYALTSLDLSGWNTANVTKTNSMFFLCKALTSLDLSTFNMTKVSNMDYMFFNCLSLTTIYGSNWDTSNVTESGEMFRGCIRLVGGAGTEYSDSNANDCPFARIDGGPDAPGYFTNGETTGIKPLTISPEGEGLEAFPREGLDGVIYTISGRKVSGKPTAKGVYVYKGKKVKR